MGVHHVFMCDIAWSGSKSAPHEVSKLKKLIVTLICLVIGTCTAGVSASAAPVTSMTQTTVVEDIADAAQADIDAIAPLVRVAGASSAKRAAERAAGGRAVKVVKKGGRFIVTVVSGGSARRCVVDAKSGQVLGCR